MSGERLFLLSIRTSGIVFLNEFPDMYMQVIYTLH